MASKGNNEPEPQVVAPAYDPGSSPAAAETGPGEPVEQSEATPAPAAPAPDFTTRDVPVNVSDAMEQGDTAEFPPPAQPAPAPYTHVVSPDGETLSVDYRTGPGSEDNTQSNQPQE